MRFYIVLGVMGVLTYFGYSHSTFYSRVEQICRTQLSRPLTPADLTPQRIAADQQKVKAFESEYAIYSRQK